MDVAASAGAGTDLCLHLVLARRPARTDAPSGNPV